MYWLFLNMYWAKFWIWAGGVLSLSRMLNEGEGIIDIYTHTHIHICICDICAFYMHVDTYMLPLCKSTPGVEACRDLRWSLYSLGL